MGDECEGGVIMCCRGLWEDTCVQCQLCRVVVDVLVVRMASLT